MASCGHVRSSAVCVVAAFAFTVFCQTPAAAQTPSSATIASNLPSGTVIPGNGGAIAGTFDLTSSIAAGEHVQSAMMTFDLVDNNSGALHLQCQASTKGIDPDAQLFNDYRDIFWLQGCARNDNLSTFFGYVTVYDEDYDPPVDVYLGVNDSYIASARAPLYDTGYRFGGIWTDAQLNCGFLLLGPCEHWEMTRSYGYAGSIRLQYVLDAAALHVLNQSGSIPFSLSAFSDPRIAGDGVTLQSGTLTIVKSSKGFPGGTATISFDDVDTSHSTIGSCTPTGGYLASFGVALTAVTPGTLVGAVTTSAPASNVLTQCGTDDHVSYTLTFPGPLAEVTFTRAPLVPGTSGGVHPAWTAHALDIDGNEVAIAGEAMIASGSSVPAQTFTLTGSGIVALRIDSDKQHVASLTAALLDDFILTAQAPTTTTWAHVAAEVPLPGSAVADVAVNPTLNKIYVSGAASEGHPITVVDGSTLGVTIAGPGAGTSVDLVTNGYWAGGGSTGKVMAYDGITNEQLAATAIGGCPVVTDVDPVHRLVWAASGCSATISALNADTGGIINAEIGQSTSLDQLHVNRATGNVYSNITGGVNRIDPATFATTPMSFGSVLGIDPVANRMYSSAGEASVGVIDGNFEAGNVIGLSFLPNSAGPAIDGQRGRLYWANAAGDTIEILDSSTLALLGTVPLNEGLHASSIAVDPRRGRVYALASGTGGNVLLIIEDPFTDTTPPATISTAAPTSRNGWHNGSVTVTLTAADNEHGSGVVSVTAAVDGAAPIAVSGHVVSLAIATEGVHTITFHATDRAGNIEAENTVSVKIDQGRPVLTLPSNLIVEATGPSATPVNFTWSAADSLSGIGSTFIDYPGGHGFPLGETIVHASAEDLAGNTVTGSFTVVVVDTTPPVMTKPANITTDATRPEGAAVTFTVSSVDLVDGGVVTTSPPRFGSTFAIGTTTVTCTAIDRHNNVSTAAFTVTVLSPAQTAANTIALVTQLGFQNGAALLENAAKALASGSLTASCNQLDAFTSQVRAQTGKQLAEAQANGLIADANHMRAALACR